MALGLVFTPFSAGWAQDAQDLRLSVPDEMIEQGFMQHLLPRFRFRARIGIDPVPMGEPAEMGFVTDVTSGARIFSLPDGQDIFLVHITNDPQVVETTGIFLSWLQSQPGRAAIEGFPREGPPLYVATAGIAQHEIAEVITGDVAQGARLSLVHCGRCHVIDQRNRMGGIGSTPSFGALRARDGWADVFRVFWTENPHPAFTQVAGVTEPFPAHLPSYIAPVEITLEEIDAILAFVATMEPKNLGQEISGN